LPFSTETNSRGGEGGPQNICALPKWFIKENSLIQETHTHTHKAICFLMNRIDQGLQITYLSGNSKLSAVLGSYPGQAHELRHIAPVIGNISHEELIEGAEATRYASGKTNEP
jgi:hypothetical protein